MSELQIDQLLGALENETNASIMELTNSKINKLSLFAFFILINFVTILLEKMVSYFLRVPSLLLLFYFPVM